MYYNSNQNSNDYYNSYKKEMAELESYRREENIQNILKLIFLVLTLLLLAAGAFYLYKYFNPTLNEKSSRIKTEKVFTAHEQLDRIVIREAELPTSIQLEESSPVVHQNVPSMSEKDIALIVQIIMSQMNTKQEIPLEQQLADIAVKTFKSQKLKDANHYNKVIVTDNQVVNTNSNALMKLSNDLNNIINEGVDSSSHYSKEIKKEVTFRKNEMRIIIVQQGDTLSRIAKKAYGNHDDYTKIFAANPEVIKNPNQIFVGQRLRIPS